MGVSPNVVRSPTPVLIADRVLYRQDASRAPRHVDRVVVSCLCSQPMQISVVGLGRLGAPLAAVFASKGFRVIGTDLNREYVDAINDGTAPVDEPRLQELIGASRALAQRHTRRGECRRRDRCDVRHRADAERRERPIQQRGRASTRWNRSARAPAQGRLPPCRHHQHGHAGLDWRRDPAGARASIPDVRSGHRSACATTRNSLRLAASYATCCGRT